MLREGDLERKEGLGENGSERRLGGDANERLIREEREAEGTMIKRQIGKDEGQGE